MIAPELSRLVKAAEIGSAPRDIVVEANEAERVALADRFGLLALQSLSGDTIVRQEAAGVRVTGRVRATATQACVISGEPVAAEVDAPLDLLFAPEAPANPDEEVELGEADCDVLPFDGQAVDIGEAVAQTFGLALDPYPRASEEAIAEARRLILSEEEAVAASNPFAALKTLPGNIQKLTTVTSDVVLLRSGVTDHAPARASPSPCACNRLASSLDAVTAA